MYLSTIYIHGIKGKYGNGKMRISANVYDDDMVIFNFELCVCPIDSELGREFVERDLSGVFEVKGINNICLAFKQVYDALQKPEDLLYTPECIKTIAEHNADWW